MQLASSIIPVSSLSLPEKNALYALLSRSFLHVSYSGFLRDLHQKHWVILLRDADSSVIAGFSTLALFKTMVDGRPVNAFYSGDTIIDRPYWGTQALARVWLNFVFSRVDQQPDINWFWFLICKGYRTYRYLPVYFKTYYPHVEKPTPLYEQTVLNSLATQLFHDLYNSQTGVIYQPDDYRLQPGISDISARELSNRHIAFFQQRNPLWSQGSELACLTELSLDNLRSIGIRSLNRALLNAA